ncbi:MAG: imidazoleglycerol-phosphate dehydratase HisB [Oscillospiraceae bacterium]|nr:imidazoleglycerol-phosphate dehydratase HisB [Oscillospiraceae bacterium]
MPDSAARKASVKRETKETRIDLELDLDGTGKYSISTGCGFFDHMLELFTLHGKFDLNLMCEGDKHTGFHHIVEDCGICLGRAFDEALSDRRGIARYGSVILPMDEALILAAADICGRSFVGFDISLPGERAGDFDSELLLEFLLSFSRSSGITLHMRKLSGENTHHIIECAFKALARTLRAAVAEDTGFKGDIPSTKGTI